MNVGQFYDNEKLLNDELEKYKHQNLLRKEPFAPSLISAHLDKAKHNLKFFQKNVSGSEFNDWLIVVLYYAAYHAALALIANKGYVSKSHESTLLFLIKEYKIEKAEAELIESLAITKSDAEFYANLKETRKQANYATNTLFRTEKVKEYQKKTIEFLNKVEEILEKNSLPK
ncbi:HEPN domain-containing protein [Candidatus Woesearchaeota archaeon]|nr:HEPN domain-containing protein [Candidatus Woesearchaeota archaeon]